MSQLRAVAVQAEGLPSWHWQPCKHLSCSSCPPPVLALGTLPCSQTGTACLGRRLLSRGIRALLGLPGWRLGLQ